MDFKKIQTLVLIILGVIIGICVTLGYQRIQGPKQTVSVTGTGEVNATTDQATISIQATNEDAAKKLKEVLLGLGIPESRITQSSDYIQPFYGIDNVPEDPTQDNMMYQRPLPVTGINFTVILDSLKNINKVFTAINNVPNTSITNTYYSLNNQKNWENKAKEMAIEDARSQAESIAKINRLKVGKLVSLTEGYYPGGMIKPMMRGGLDSATIGTLQQDNPNTTKSGSEITYNEQTVKITASYTVQYELYSFLNF